MTRDHICLASIDWRYLWQGPQEIMTRFAKAGGRVIYVNHAGIRRPYLEDWRRLTGRLMDWMGRPGGRDVPEAPGVTVISPIVLPFPWSRMARFVNALAFARQLPGIAERNRLKHPVVWSFVPTPFAIDSLRALRSVRSVAIYYCVADFEALSDRPREMMRSEDRLLRDVDIVFAGGRVLAGRFAGRHDRVVLAPFSVGDHFFDHRHPEPADIGAIPRPRVLYVGGLHRHVDRELLAVVMSRLPHVQFVFVGPKVSGDWDIEAFANAHFIGRRSYASLPAYIDAADVGLVPYQLSRFTETVWPTKLHEYLARGKPVVSTPLREVELLGYPSVDVSIGSGAENMALAIETLIAHRDDRSEARRELAREYSWDRTLSRMSAEIELIAGRR